MPEATQQQDEMFMQQALTLAGQAQADDEVPVGALITLHDEIIGEGYNRPVASHDASAHAEMIAMRQAGLKLHNYRLPGATLYVTLEPCAMCAGAMLHARIARLVYGAADPAAGAAGSVFNILQSGQLNHQTDVTGGVLAPACGALLTDFFRQRR
ncbi:MAG: tRNA adenosine(34) deaminase TadA [Gammaproteobacteria bacterium]